MVLTTMGRAPKSHPFPFNHFFSKVDISDPYTFLGIKRGILQYVWLKPILCLLIVLMKATGTYQQNYIGLKSGYMWLGIIYNLSISVSLYCLALFWYCLVDDLRPFRPLPKFLCIKIIIFFSYWQGVLLAILVWTGLIHDVGYYTPDNIATAIQNTLMCIEMLGFAVGHWYAFTYKEFASSSLMGYARLTVPFAVRDAFGIVDLMIDFKTTFFGSDYTYREFNSIETVLEHPDSRSRQARLSQGLRYTSGGVSKYWLPTLTQQGSMSISNGRNHSQPLVGSNCNENKSLTSSEAYKNYGGISSPKISPIRSPSRSNSPFSSNSSVNSTIPEVPPGENFDDFTLSKEEMQFDDRLYRTARNFPYGDYNVCVFDGLILYYLTNFST